MSKNSIISTISFLAILALSFYFWTLQKSIVLSGGSYNISAIWQSAAVLLGLLVFAGLCIAISSDYFFGILSAGVLPAMFLLRFGFSDKMYLIVAGAGIILGVLAYASARRDRASRIKLGISVAGGGVRLYFIVTLLLVTALLYRTNFVKGEVKISETQIQYIMPVIENQIKSQVPFYSSDITADHLIVVSALSSGEVIIKTGSLSANLQKKIQQKIAEQSLKDMQTAIQRPEIQKLLIEDFIASNPKKMAELREKYGQQFGIQINQGQSFISALVLGINSYIKKMLLPFKNYLPIVLTVAFFLGLEAVSGIFVSLAMVVSGILFHFLKASGILSINKIPVMQEILEN